MKANTTKREPVLDPRNLDPDDDTTWEAQVKVLAEKIEEELPGSRVTVDGIGWHVEIHWQDGPGPREVKRLLEELLGKEAQRYRGDEEGIDLMWENLNVELWRSHSSRARGYALLSAALAGSCRKCDPAAKGFASVYDSALRTGNPTEPTQHQNLVGLTLLGAQSAELEALAELLGALHDTLQDAETLHHNRGHLAGLVQIGRDLNT